MFWFLKKGEDVQTLKKRLEDIDINIKQSFSHLKEDMKEIGSWISHFNADSAGKDRNLKALEAKIHGLERKVRHESTKIEHQNLEHVQPFKRSVQPFMNVQPYVQPLEQQFERINKESKEDIFNRLTPAQKRVVGLLVYSGGPMDYEEISRRLEINPITARRHLNDVKRAGFNIKRKVSDKSRKNLYYIDEKIREEIIKEARKSTKEG